MSKGGSRVRQFVPLISKCVAGAIVVGLALTGCTNLNKASGEKASVLMTAPQGLTFYNPPSPLPPGTHGDAIWARPLHTAAALRHAAQNWLILYRSTDINGRPVAVSGTLAVPKGSPPPGGWPVISWAHGTTGTADVCAPSRDSATYPDRGYINGVNRTLDKWVQQGYAVVETDYQGLGTPGPHPYLVGNSEARGVTDMVLAARQVSPNLSRDWLVMGHSQGGGAAIFTAHLGPIYAPELHLVGAVAIAPASHIGEALHYFLAHANQRTSPFIPLVIQGAEAASPAVKPEQFMTPLGLKELKLADQRCLNGLRKPDALGALTTKQILRQHGNYSSLNYVLTDFDGSEHAHPLVPLLVLQAANDRVVLKVLTDQAVGELCALGTDLTYRTYMIKNAQGVGAAHRRTVDVSLPAAMKWVAARFGGAAASSNCKQFLAAK